MIEALAYPSFLGRVRRALLQHDARDLLSSSSSPQAVLPGWDCLILLSDIGMPTLAAVGNGDGASLDELQARVDELSDRVAGSGMLSGGGLRLLMLLVFSQRSEVSRHAVSLSPRRFYQGLRPSLQGFNLADGSIAGGASPLGLASRGNPLADAAGAAWRGQLAPPESMTSTRTGSWQATGAVMSRQPVLTYLLIAVNVAIFLLLYLNGGPDNANTLVSFGALVPALVSQGEWWRLFTTMFLHASVPHILFNMMALYVVGSLAERLYGSSKYLALYLGSGLLASVTSFVYGSLSGNANVPAVGASGAIFGILGALVTLRFQHSEVIPRAVLTRVSASMIPMVILNLGFAFLIPHVDNSAHLGGLVGGMALSLVLRVPTRVRVGATEEVGK